MKVVGFIITCFLTTITRAKMSIPLSESDGVYYHVMSNRPTPNYCWIIHLDRVSNDKILAMFSYRKDKEYHLHTNVLYQRYHIDQDTNCFETDMSLEDLFMHKKTTRICIYPIFGKPNLLVLTASNGLIGHVVSRTPMTSHIDDITVSSIINSMSFYDINMTTFFHIDNNQSNCPNIPT